MQLELSFTCYRRNNRSKWSRDRRAVIQAVLEPSQAPSQPSGSAGDNDDWL